MVKSVSLLGLVRLIIYCLLPLIPLYLIAQHLNVHNPASPYFFIPDSKLYGDAFISPHSDFRIATATALIKNYSQDFSYLSRSDGQGAVSNGVPVQRDDVDGEDEESKLSIGIVSVNRPDGIQYLDSCLGSVLEGLSRKEREKIHLSTFIADLDPSAHPFWNENWLWDLNDEIVVRDDSKSPGNQDENDGSKEARTRINKQKFKPLPPDLLRKLEENPTSQSHSQRKSKTSPWHRKETLDYTTIMTSCLDSKSKYCLILEDDVILKRNWFGILKDYIQQAERLDGAEGSKNHQLHWNLFKPFKREDRKRSFKPWVFMRLFYAEKYFGWEDTEVKSLIIQGVCCFLIFYLSLSTFRSSLFSREEKTKMNQGWNPSFKSSTRSPSPSRFLSTLRRLSGVQLFLFCLVILPYYGLFILSGRNHHPNHSIPFGLSTMNQRGCCTQSLLFKTEFLPGLKGYLEKEENLLRRPKDLLTIEFALNGDEGEGEGEGEDTWNRDGKVTEEREGGREREREKKGEKKEAEKETFSYSPNNFKGGKILAVRPMLTQHIGHSSSRNQGFRRKSRVWGFGFEKEWKRRDW